MNLNNQLLTQEKDTYPQTLEKRRNIRSGILLWCRNISFLVFAVTALSSAFAAQVSAAIVETDKLDYYPGDTVIITGSGWQPGEQVEIYLIEEPLIHPAELWYVQADANGGIYNAEYIIQEHDLGQTFYLTATGQSSGLIATTVFTDSPRVGSVSVGVQTLVAGGDADESFEQCAGTSFKYTVTVTRGSGMGSSGSFRAILSVTGLPLGASSSLPSCTSPALSNCVEFGSGDATKIFTLTINTTSGTTLTGATTFTVKAQSSTNSGDNASGDGTLTVVGNGDSCRSSFGVCDLADSCNAGACVDTKSTAVCRGVAAGDAGACDIAESCDGINNNCPADGFKSSSTVCRSDAGQCDVEEKCTGTSAACPTDLFESAATICTGTSNGGACDATDHCSGSADTCVDEFKASSTVCRPSAGQCDVAESCTGSSGACPVDGFASTATVCTGTSNGGACDATDHCSGSANTCVDEFKAASVVCRPEADGELCDVAESCTGTSGECPLDGFKAASEVCRAAVDACDVAENCTGTSAACPVNGFAAVDTACGDTDDTACNASDSCDGSGSCVDRKKASGFVCLAGDASGCNPDDVCNGTTNGCAAVYTAENTACGDTDDTACNAPDSCDGSGSCIDRKKAANTVCRDVADVCDQAESCDGVSNDCPADGFVASDTSCEDDDTCSQNDTCNGSSASCQPGPDLYTFTGFFPPVDNLPTWNKAKAGSAIPVKFKLGGNKGLNVFQAGYPLSQKINCDNNVPLDDVTETVTAGGSSLQYDAAADQYIYVWKTDKAWAGTCRQLTVKFNPGCGINAIADFNFFK